ncbi:MAG: HD domain-containing protein [Planctomycetes bacterium]|nr:HD domain-containing protein [Planctomycetota bacterium]
MIVNPRVPLHRLVLSLSEALDHVHPEITQHQQRVAYIATKMARQMGIGQPDLVDVFLAAVIHDIGLIGPRNRIRALHLGQLEAVAWHSEVGCLLLKDNPLFARAAEIVRFHHVAWNGGRGSECNGCPVPLASFIVGLADTVEVALKRREPVLEQADRVRHLIQSRKDRQFPPDCVEAFLDVSTPEAFWLDIISDQIYGILLTQIDWPTIEIDAEAFIPIAEIFARLVDASSHWTAVHTAGVAAVAVALAERLGFSRREQCLMRTAGYLHDLGKLAIPTEILDKPGRLTEQERLMIRTHTYHTFRILDTIGGMRQINEWASFHHERLDGKGYPFRHRGEDLTLGSRIMAVADVCSALSEERPYHEGMPQEKALGILDDLVKDGALDGDVVGVLRRDYDAIDHIRRQEQEEYHRKQQSLFSLVDRHEGSM